MRGVTMGVLAGLAWCTVSCAPPPPEPAEPSELTVFAAASAGHAVEMAAEAFAARHNVEVLTSFDSSANLARQILSGAPVDVFISAHPRWMDELETAGALVADSRRAFLGNELVLIAPLGETIDVTFDTLWDLRSAYPHVERIAIGDPGHVPAGMYARQALEALGWWDDLEALLVPAQDVRGALRLVEIGEADLGFVYATDTRDARSVYIVKTVPASLHDPIEYPVALCKDSPLAVAFIAHLLSDEMRELFAEAGFRVLHPSVLEDP